MAQIDSSEDAADVANLAQTAALDEDLAQVADFLAQLDEEDIDVITTYLSQQLSSADDEDGELELAQTDADDGDMLN